MDEDVGCKAMTNSAQANSAQAYLAQAHLAQAYLGQSTWASPVLVRPIQNYLNYNHNYTCNIK